MSPLPSNRSGPSLALLIALAGCVALVILPVLVQTGDSGQAAAVSPVPTAAAAAPVASPTSEVAAEPTLLPALTAEPAPNPTSEPAALPAITATPTSAPTVSMPTDEPVPRLEPDGYDLTVEPQRDWNEPVPQGEAADQEEWFADAVFIGDSRMDGFRLYSGVTKQADFLVSNGITVFEVMEGKEVVRRRDEKISILDALGEKRYGKVYISLGVNELGCGTEGYGETYGELIDAVRDIQPRARIYIQTIPPVNAAKCAEHDQFYYVNNENVAAFNEVLTRVCAEKQVYRLDVPDALVDGNGECPYDLSADGVHFKKEGYVLWLDYLTTHTGT